jgi:hypothetical protein
MKNVTHSKVNSVLITLPLNKLPQAYRFLLKLSREATETKSYQEEFMALPLAEQDRLMTEQAVRMVSYYEQTADERELWQGGDIVDY